MGRTMKFEDWKKLQNGSDIRGVALDGIAGEEVNLTPEVATILGNLAASLLRNGPSDVWLAVLDSNGNRVGRWRLGR